MALSVGWVGSKFSGAWPGSHLPREDQILLGYPQLVSVALGMGGELRTRRRSWEGQ